jgi:hypothetical protein
MRQHFSSTLFVVVVVVVVVVIDNITLQTHHPFHHFVAIAVTTAGGGGASRLHHYFEPRVLLVTVSVGPACPACFFFDSSSRSTDSSRCVLFFPRLWSPLDLVMGCGWSGGVEVVWLIRRGLFCFHKHFLNRG